MAPKRQEVMLLVDGYNVIGIWADLYPNPKDDTPLQQRNGSDLEAARSKLIEELVNFSAFEGYETQVVFDAHSRDTPAYREIITPNLSVYYTEFRETADTYIEKFCASHKSNVTTKTRLLVATSDRAQQLTVGGFGAEWMSARQLVNRVESSSRRSRQKQQTTRQSSGRFLFNSLKPEAQARLSALRHGIPPDQ
jgi:predicted RNA-binding protein with PIN domain